MLIKIKSGAKEAAEPKLLDLRYVTVHAYLLDPRQLGESATDTHVSNDLFALSRHRTKARAALLNR